MSGKTKKSRPFKEDAGSGKNWSSKTFIEDTSDGKTKASKVIKIVTAFATVLGLTLHFRNNFLIALLTAVIALLIFAVYYIYQNWSLTFRPRRLKANDFMRKVNIKEIKTIRLLGHTGGNLFTSVQQKLDEISHDDEHKARIYTQVIVRHPKAEVSSRSDQIIGTEKTVKRLGEYGFNIELRFYQDLPAHRGIICEYVNGRRLIYLSAYYWPEDKSKAFPYPMIIKDSVRKKNPLAVMLESWINHYWGGGRVHTIVFDFDDTLAPTMDIQVEAWMEAIELALERESISHDALSPDLRESRSTPEAYRRFLKAIFVKHQMAEQIIDVLLPGIDAEKKRDIDSERFEIRKRLVMEKGTLFPGVEEEIRKLRDSYQLAIITATSSTLVNRFLNRWNLTECFSIILGKDDPEHAWENVHRKAFRLIEVSGLTGVPLDRLVFIGDNSADYLAAAQLGIYFIEAAQTAQSVGIDSLIRPAAKKGRRSHRRFFRFTDRTLENFIEELDREEI